MAERRLKRLAKLGALTGRVAGRTLRDRAKGAVRRGAARGQNVLSNETAEDITNTLGRLKGVAMKAGQQLAMVASHMDLPEEIQRKLELLHDTAEPIPFDQIETALREELGGDLSTHFTFVDPNPLGTASLAQAHAARTHSDEEIVLKVMHDGVRESLETDLLTLKGMVLGSRALGRSSGEANDVFDEISTHLRLELDYLQESANIHTFHTLFGNDARFRVPKLHPQWCTERVLAMDRIPGLPHREFLETASPEARQRAGLSLAEWFFESTFRHRVLHADPHPGNFLFDIDGTMGVVDFGCVKRFNEFFIGQYAAIVMHAFEQDYDALRDTCVEMGLWDGRRSEAGDIIVAFCDAVVAPWRHGETELGSGDDLVQRVKPIVGKIWKYPEIRGAKDMVLLHRTLGGLYSFAREFRVRADWKALMWPHLIHAIDVSEGRIAS